MPTAESALVEYETGQTFTAMSALTNSGDNKKFTSAASSWSSVTGFAPIVLVDGLLTGGIISIAASSNDDEVDIGISSSNIGGLAVTAIASTGVSATRGVSDGFRVTSIIKNSSGTYTAVAGTESTAFSEIRGAAGGPPFIPVGEIEIGQIRFTSTVAAPVLASEIFQISNVHQERSRAPNFTINDFAGEIDFTQALSLIHTASVPKGVFASYAEPVFIEQDSAVDFAPPEISTSVSSTQLYNKTVAAFTRSLGQGSFTAQLEDGITDDIIGLQGETLFFKFFPDRNLPAHILNKGVLEFARSFSATDNISAAFTISSAQRGIDKLS